MCRRRLTVSEQQLQYGGGGESVLIRGHFFNIFEAPTYLLDTMTVHIHILIFLSLYLGELNKLYILVLKMHTCIRHMHTPMKPSPCLENKHFHLPQRLPRAPSSWCPVPSLPSADNFLNVLSTATQQ